MPTACLLIARTRLPNTLSYYPRLLNRRFIMSANAHSDFVHHNAQYAAHFGAKESLALLPAKKLTIGMSGYFHNVHRSAN
jgi:hypothetical protein